MRYLTTHLGPGDCYTRHLQALEEQQYDFTVPYYWLSEEVPTADKKRVKTDYFFRTLFRLLHAPFILVWRFFIKPRVPEREFTSTFRLGFVLLGYPIIWSIILLVATLLLDWTFALFLPIAFLFLNTFISQNRLTKDDSTADTKDEPEGQQH